MLALSAAMARHYTIGCSGGTSAKVAFPGDKPRLSQSVRQPLNVKANWQEEWLVVRSGRIPCNDKSTKRQVLTTHKFEIEIMHT